MQAFSSHTENASWSNKVLNFWTIRSGKPGHCITLIECAGLQRRRAAGSTPVLLHKSLKGWLPAAPSSCSLSSPSSLHGRGELCSGRASLEGLGLCQSSGVTSGSTETLSTDPLTASYMGDGGNQERAVLLSSESTFKVESEIKGNPSP